MTYTKLASSIIRSTIWSEPDHVRIVWITMLALCDEHGVVEASIPGLAHEAHVAVHLCEEALARFQAPDPYSRSPELEGRRIVAVRGGWRLVNHDYYRGGMRDDRRRPARTPDPGTPLIDRARDGRTPIDHARDGAIDRAPGAMDRVIRSDHISSDQLTLSESECVSEGDQAVSSETLSSATKRKVKAAAPTPEPRRALLDAFEATLLQCRGIACRPAASKVHLGVATEVLETCRGDLEEAKALAALYVQIEDDRWIVDHKWPFRWFASRLPRLTAERSKRREPPRAAQIRAALAELQVLTDQGADVAEQAEALRRELEQAQGYRRET